MTTYSVTIRLDAASIAALQGHQLQVFKGVKACDPDQGVSTVWATVDRFYHLIHLSWRSECHGFFHVGSLHDDDAVVPTWTEPVQPGELLTLEKGAQLTRTVTGARDAYTLLNRVGRPVWAGLMSALRTYQQGGRPSPLCVFPHRDGDTRVLEPYEKIVLVFSPKKRAVGTAVKQCIARSVSLHFFSSISHISVDYSHQRGWDTLGNPVAKRNGMNLLLAPELIVPSFTQGVFPGDLESLTLH
ncbi:hypothetical protein [Vibrio coralliilyticus]|uniref:hypothetical protein n=1 Tax=Vibrio coralliilyticus TaxID=190893 RepID=UPI000C16DE85|nr:hypothetical protein [Vibrio coralliilyticus]